MFGAALIGSVFSLAVIWVPPTFAAPAQSTPARSSSDWWHWPVSSQSIVRGYDAGHSTYGPGHRGIDIAAQSAEPVVAVEAGTVTFAGQVAGIATITIDHGSERSTYQPVQPNVVVGDQVHAGEPIGRVGSGHTSCSTPCLHLGRLVGGDHADPAAKLPRFGEIVLISPDAPVPQPPVSTNNGAVLPEAVITSPFGMRRHPITGIYKLHDGVDYGASCGTPVSAASAGTVVIAGWRGAYGMQVAVQHLDATLTSYSHLSSLAVQVGAQVTAGQVIGRVGTTGMSTGCHLHYMVVINGTPVDPLTWRPD